MLESFFLYTGIIFWSVILIILIPIVTLFFLWFMYVFIMSIFISLWIVPIIAKSDQYPNYNKIKLMDFYYCFLDRFKELFDTSNFRADHYGFYIEKKNFIIKFGKNKRKRIKKAL